MHDSDLSQAEAVTEYADRCAACGDCSWFGFVTTVYVCEYWKAGSCAARQDQPGHNIYLRRSQGV